jgi:phosphoribosylamine--glycine ligase
MRVLVVGSGAREHAITWKLHQSPKVRELLVAPGNAGTSTIAHNLPVSAENVDDLVGIARERKVDLVFVGPEGPLAAGLVDRLQDAGIPSYGPSKAAARIEASKAFSKSLMQQYGIPHAKGESFADIEAARAYLAGMSVPVVVKADGLAAGKGVIIARTRDEAMAALRDCMERKAFGTAGDTVVIEEYLAGPEVSAFAFTDGEYVSPLAAACDYKRALDGDEGLNTGGMGSYSPPTFWTSELAQRIRREVMEPTVKALARAGSPFRGVLYGGIMLTKDGPKVLEFNCRLGDPETQVILPLLKSDLVDIVMATLDGRLSRMPIAWDNSACVGVVMASGGYPGKYSVGFPITGLESVSDDVVVFHAGTKKDMEGRTITNGGRVVTVTAKGTTLQEAREAAYAGVSRINFKDAHCRKDIALFKNAC